MSKIITQEFKIEFVDTGNNVLGSDFFEAEGYPDDCYREAERFAEQMLDADSFGAVGYKITKHSNCFEEGCPGPVHRLYNESLHKAICEGCGGKQTFDNEWTYQCEECAHELKVQEKLYGVPIPRWCKTCYHKEY